MACATLKRSLDLDPLSIRPSKRRRYMPATPTKEEEPSPFAEVSPRLNMEQISIHIKEEMKRLHRRKKLYYGGPSSDREVSPTTGGPSSPPSDGDSSPSSSSQQQHHHHTPGQSKQDKHLFTFRQVGMICERLLKDREDSLRELYDQVLNAKLAEQYDTFVKFTYDQIQKRFENAAAPSYLS